MRPKVVKVLPVLKPVYSQITLVSLLLLAFGEQLTPFLDFSVSHFCVAKVRASCFISLLCLYNFTHFEVACSVVLLASLLRSKSALLAEGEQEHELLRRACTRELSEGNKRRRSHLLLPQGSLLLSGAVARRRGACTLHAKVSANSRVRSFAALRALLLRKSGRRVVGASACSPALLRSKSEASKRSLHVRGPCEPVLTDHASSR